MKRYYTFAITILGFIALVSSCKKKDNGPSVKAYTVPTAYAFSNANYTKATQRVKMVVELDAYLKKPNAGSTLVSIDQTTINNLFNNTGNPYTDASLNASGINMREATSDADWIKSFADSVVLYNTGVAASAGVGGSVPRGTNKIIVGPRGLEYGQAYTKGIMGSLFFKEAVRLLTLVKTMPAGDTITAQAYWDEAFGYLAIPSDYDSAKTYTSSDPNRPLLWGGYLAERGKAIQAGGTLFEAFRKGRAAIGGYDVAVRNAQADIILAKWEQLSAAAALNYVTAPTASSAIGNLGTQFHALSEGFGFIMTFKYRPSTSKLSIHDFETLTNIINKDYYALISQAGFTDLVTAQNILKNTYGL